MLIWNGWFLEDEKVGYNLLLILLLYKTQVQLQLFAYIDDIPPDVSAN